MKDKTKEKLSKWYRSFVEGLSYIGIGLGLAIAGIISFVVGTSVIWLPTMLIIFAIKGII